MSNPQIDRLIPDIEAMVNDKLQAALKGMLGVIVHRVVELIDTQVQATIGKRMVIMEKEVDSQINKYKAEMNAKTENRFSEFCQSTTNLQLSFKKTLAQIE